MKIRFPSLAASHSESFSWLLETSDDLCDPLLKVQGLLIKKQTSDPNDRASCYVRDLLPFFLCCEDSISFLQIKQKVSMLMYVCAVLYWTWVPKLAQQMLHLKPRQALHSPRQPSPTPPPFFPHFEPLGSWGRKSLGFLNGWECIYSSHPKLNYSLRCWDLDDHISAY